MNIWQTIKSFFIRDEEGSLVRFARKELTLAGWFSEDSDYSGMMGEEILEMIQRFSQQGHSGYSARLAATLFERLAKYEPLTPLTGEEEEWFEVGDGVYQNNRCPRVFKDEYGAYDIDGKVFRTRDGFHYTNHESKIPVTFPYTPKTEYIDV